MELEDFSSQSAWNSHLRLESEAALYRQLDHPILVEGCRYLGNAPVDAREVGFSVTCPLAVPDPRVEHSGRLFQRLTASRPLEVSFREQKVALCHVPEANGFGTN